jgi:hypothetical protein
MKRTAPFFVCAICLYAQFRFGPPVHQSLSNNLSGAKTSPAAGNTLRNVKVGIRTSRTKDVTVTAGSDQLGRHKSGSIPFSAATFQSLTATFA